MPSRQHRLSLFGSKGSSTGLSDTGLTRIARFCTLAVLLLLLVSCASDEEKRLRAELDAVKSQRQELQVWTENASGILKTLKTDPARAQAMLKQWEKTGKPSTNLDKLAELIGTLILYGLIIAVHVNVVWMLVKTALETDSLARWFALAMGFSIYFVCQKYGYNFGDFITKTAQTMDFTPLFWVVGVVSPASAGSLLCYLFLKHIKKYAVKGQRFVLLFGAALTAVTLDIFKESYDSNNLANFIFIVSFSFMYLLISPRGGIPSQRN